MKNSVIWLLAVSILIAACKKDKKEKTGVDASVYIKSNKVAVNPSGFAPLTAVITLETSIATRVSIRVTGKHGTASDVTKEFEQISTQHSIPVLGLYAAYDNVVELTLFNDADKNLGSTNITISTVPLLPDLPQIAIDIPSPNLENDMTLVSYLGAPPQSGLPHNPFIFDDFGDIRWYVDFTSSAVLNTLNIQNGVEKLANGNLYFGDLRSNAVYEMDMFGNTLNTWSLSNTEYTFHHQVLEKPDGNFLITVTKNGIATTQDHVIEINRASGEIVTVWDFRQSLQPGRTAWSTNAENWLHMNALEYDSTDDCLIISGRVQGLVKVDASNNVKWILAPHRGWGNAGNGVDLNTKLLQPLNAQGTPILNPAVLDGAENHPDFEWNWYQHAPKVLNDGGLLLFDNGDTRNYKEDSLYSRIVKYRIDQTAMTIQQKFQYGKERGVETYASFVSDVDFNDESGNFIFSPGAVNDDGPIHGKIVEVNSNTNEVVFEATVTPPPTVRATFHRTERMRLYR